MIVTKTRAKGEKKTKKRKRGDGGRKQVCEDQRSRCNAFWWCKLTSRSSLLLQWYTSVTVERKREKKVKKWGPKNIEKKRANNNISDWEAIYNRSGPGQLPRIYYSIRSVSSKSFHYKTIQLQKEKTKNQPKKKKISQSNHQMEDIEHDDQTMITWICNWWWLLSNMWVYRIATHRQKQTERERKKPKKRRREQKRCIERRTPIKTSIVKHRRSMRRGERSFPSCHPYFIYLFYNEFAKLV